MTAEPTVENKPQHDSAPEPAVSPGVGEYVMVDPARVEIGPNTRTDVHLDPHFSADIRDRGVRTPISLRRRASDGTLVLRAGQRRLLAAQRNQLAAVPAGTRADLGELGGDRLGGPRPRPAPYRCRNRRPPGSRYRGR